MSAQYEFLKAAIVSGVDVAANAQPSAVRADEMVALRKMSKDELEKLLEVRKVIDQKGNDFEGVVGIGIFSF